MDESCQRDFKKYVRASALLTRCSVGAITVRQSYPTALFRIQTAFLRAVLVLVRFVGTSGLIGIASISIVTGTMLQANIPTFAAKGRFRGPACVTWYEIGRCELAGSEITSLVIWRRTMWSDKKGEDKEGPLAKDQYFCHQLCVAFTHKSDDQVIEEKKKKSRSWVELLLWGIIK